jgi:hypothetical protein
MFHFGEGSRPFDALSCNDMDAASFCSVPRKFVRSNEGFFFIFNSYGGVRLSASGTPAINGPIVSVAMIDEYETLDEIRSDSENHSTRGKLAALLICSL